jgi:hypothetical protein
MLRAASTPVSRPVPDGETPDTYVYVPSRRVAGMPTVAPGETPDDFVYVSPRRATATPGVLAAPAAAGAELAPLPLPLSTRPPEAVTVYDDANLKPAAVGTMSSPREEPRVAAVLNQYARAYARLDAEAARAVWPSVDERALARAFAALSSQDVAFDDCSIEVQGPKANASCRGTARYVGKVGNGQLRTEPRVWRFELHRDGEAWKIANAEARRQ